MIEHVLHLNSVSEGIVSSGINKLIFSFQKQYVSLFQDVVLSLLVVVFFVLKVWVSRKRAAI